MKIKKRVVLFLITLLQMVFFGAYHPKAEAYTNPVTTMKIGLYYGSNTLKAANLENHTGSGYTFGYYDSARAFHPVGYTNETKITMLKDWNMYLSDGTYEDEEPEEYSEVIGCYHIKLSLQYGSFEEARAAAAGYANAFPAYYSGIWNVCVGNYCSYADAEAAMNLMGLSGTPMTASSYCVTVAVTGTAKILFEFDCGNDSSLAVMPNAAGGEPAVTWFKNNKYCGAFQYRRINGGDLTVVNFVPIEDYVKGVVPYEMNNTWPIEALKAQAMCARTYAASHLNAHSSYGFDLCNSDCCQVYRGQSQVNETINQAVDSTAGLYILYNNQLCQTFYHSSDGGATENSENVFVKALPYLKGVVDSYEKTVNTGYASWTFTYTAEEITWILQTKGYSCGNIVSVTPTYTQMGNIYSLKFTDENGKNLTFSRADAGSILCSRTLGKMTYSQRFTLVAEGAAGSPLYINNSQSLVEDPGGLHAIGGDGSVQSLGNLDEVTVLTGTGSETIKISDSGQVQSGNAYVVSGSGWGHNVGMSQYGARAMANLGFTYQDIIKFYFTGVTIG
jgi:stage II sporulation protein D